MPSKVPVIALFIAAMALCPVAQSSLYNEFVVLEGHNVVESYTSPLPHTYIEEKDLPSSFSWANVNGKSFLTHTQNQHLPQYCGSCWSFGALSSLSDRIKIARNASGDEINLSVQYLLNCGGDVAGSCHGGSHTGVYQFIQTNGFVPYDTCQPYLSCSSESKDGFCPQIDTSCSAINTCRTCDRTGCYAVNIFPNASLAEYGIYSVEHGSASSVANKIKAEIYARGPVAAVVNALPLFNYEGGIMTDTHFWSKWTNHIVSIVGWGTDKGSGEQHWIVRNSWGDYWGEMGFFRIVLGKNALGIETQTAWATPLAYSVENSPCNEDASNCAGRVNVRTEYYVDPSENGIALGELRSRPLKS